MLRPSRHLGPLAMLAAAVFFTVMGIFVHLCAQLGVPAAEITFVRFSFGLGVLAVLAGTGRIRIRVGNPRLLMARGGVGAVAVLLFHAALSNTSLSNANLLNQTATLWAPLFAAHLLQERARLRAIAALLVAAVGVALVTGSSFGHLQAGDLYGLVSGACGGLAITIVRQLRRSGMENAWSVFFFLCLVGAPLAGLLTLADFRMPVTAALAPLLAVAVAGTVAQLLLTFGYRYCTTAQGGTLTLSNVALYTLAGYWIFGEALSPQALGGSFLVLSSCVYAAAHQA